MKKIIVLTSLLVISLTKTFSQNADALKGVWLNEQRDVKVEIFKSGDKYSGKIIWTKEMYEADGKTLKKDNKNSNEQLRNRNILNLIILSGLTYNDGEWTGGEVYNPKNGKTYDCRLKLKGNNLEVRGYLGSPLFGKTSIWTKTS